MSPPKAEPYHFTRDFEEAVAWLTAAHPAFYGAAGHAVEGAGCATQAARLLVDAAQALGREHGHGPGSTLVVCQRLARWRAEGAVTHEGVEAAVDLCERVEAGTPLDMAAVMAELVPVLRGRAERKALHEGIAAVGKGDGLDRLVDDALAARGLGRLDAGVGTALRAGSHDEIEAARTLDRLPTGVMELDIVLNGGPPRGTLTVLMGNQKAGKSMCAGHIACSAMRRRQFVVYASLENPRYIVLARLMANLTGVSIDALLRGDTAASRAAMAVLEPSLGPLYVQRFPAKTTSVKDLQRWVGECERLEGRSVDLVVVDYLDKCRPEVPPKKGGGAASKSDSLYAAMSDIYEAARQWAEDTKKWVVTPTQGRGRPDDKRGSRKDVLGLGDEADSVEKSRVADLVISLNPRDEGKQIYFWVAGNRNGPQDVGAGPIPVDFACGRVAPAAPVVTGNGGW